jgi:hypothetical protein
MIRLLKLISIGLLGYLGYTIYEAWAKGAFAFGGDASNDTGAGSGVGRDRSFESADDTPTVGGQVLSGGGEGQQEVTGESNSGIAASHIVGRGVISARS